ncbi:MAG: hypothetical protein ACRDEA_03825 [Microcystaceae cyanobacterium]
MSKTLDQFVTWFNNDRINYQADYYGTFDVKRFTEDFSNSVQGSVNTRFGRGHVSLSILNKPLILLAMKKLDIPDIEYNKRVSSFMTFTFGHIFESWILELMQAYGCEVTDCQKTVKIKGIVGHIDCMVNGQIVEIKTMSKDYFYGFTKSPNNARGYITQLASYWHATGEPEATWLCFDKANNKLKLIQPNYEVLEEEVHYVYSTISELNNINSLDDLTTIDLPSPTFEIYQAKRTGNRLVPPSLKEFNYIDCFFQTRVGKNNYGRLVKYIDHELEPCKKKEKLVQTLIP